MSADGPIGLLDDEGVPRVPPQIGQRQAVHRVGVSVQADQLLGVQGSGAFPALFPVPASTFFVSPLPPRFERVFTGRRLDCYAGAGLIQSAQPRPIHSGLW